MKKPLILLVDDDQAVLAALEAALTPVFAAICRIESFTEPGEVLSALPGWVAEKRVIALAVVDQKMPGMSGVELLQALRGEPACATMKAILLTGYAGLDSAVAAKNAGGIDRYLEKPWQARALIGVCADLLVTSLAAADTLAAYTFRPIATVDELICHLQVRHEIYKSARTAVFLSGDDGLEMDIDAYDLTARHYGLFHVTYGGETLVGTHRIVDQRESDLAGELRTLAAGDARIAARLHEPRAHALPFLRYFPPDSLADEIRPWVTDHLGSVFEATRFAIASSHRRGAREHFFLARHVVASQAARMGINNGEHGFTAVAESHARFYVPFGFQDRARAIMEGIPGVLLQLEIETMPLEAIAHCRPLAERIRRTDAACCCAAFPECVGSSYVSDDFRSVDILCPLLAQRLLLEDVRT